MSEEPPIAKLLTAKNDARRSTKAASEEARTSCATLATSAVQAASSVRAESKSRRAAACTPASWAGKSSAASASALSTSACSSVVALCRGAFSAHSCFTLLMRKPAAGPPADPSTAPNRC